MEHAEATLNLLESTQGMLNSNIHLKMDNDGAGDELKEQVDRIIGPYNESWSCTAEELKSDLDKGGEYSGDFNL